MTMGLALSNDGKPVPSTCGVGCGLIPKGAKNVAVAKDFLKYLIQPKICALAPGGVFIDVKSAVARDAVPPGVHYWSL